jgi:purine-binding chemotaxis protein CheW
MKGKRPQRAEATEWKALRQRLARATAATAAAQELSPERAAEILRERAQALARAPAAATRRGQTLHVAIFALAQERYALETAHIREVVRLTDFTPIPGAPAFVVGVINLRGEILAVIDLRQFLGVAVQGVTDLSRVLVLGHDRAEFGVLADAVHEVQALSSDDVLEPPGSVAGIGREYLRGVTADALILLDGAVLLNDTRLVVDQGEETGTAGRQGDA